jgi:hypothetical protein
VHESLALSSGVCIAKLATPIADNFLYIWLPSLATVSILWTAATPQQFVSARFLGRQSFHHHSHPVISLQMRTLVKLFISSVKNYIHRHFRPIIGTKLYILSHILSLVEICSAATAATNDVTIWRIRVACWISKATCTHSHARAHVIWYMHISKSARAHARTHIWNIDWFSKVKIIRYRPSILRCSTLPVLSFTVLKDYSCLVLYMRSSRFFLHCNCRGSVTYGSLLIVICLIRKKNIILQYNYYPDGVNSNIPAGNFVKRNLKII